MRKKSELVILILLTVCMTFGCIQPAQTSEQPSNASETPSVSADVSPEPVPTWDLVPGTAETPQPDDTVTVETERTEKPTAEPVTPEPVPSDTPESTPTPEPNPYVGVWTIEDLPFSLEFRSDGTYLVTVSEQEKEGTYSFDSNSILLSVADEKTVELHYYAKADTLKIDDLKLIRDELVFFFPLDSIPVTYKAENDDLFVSVRGAVAEVRAKEGKKIGRYRFTTVGVSPSEKTTDWFDVSDSGEAADMFRVFKYDGEYTLWTTDENGEPLGSIDVSVRSGFRYALGADGLETLRDPLSAVLKNEGSSIDEMNRAISKDVAAAGMFSRTGVVTAAVSLCSRLAEYGYALPCQGHGSYQSAREWGVNPNWGARINPGTGSEAEHSGMHSAASIIWAYRQAGMNLYPETDTTIVMLGETKRSRDNKIAYDRAESGDIIKNGNRYMMVIDRLDQNGNGEDDAYLVYDMTAPQLSVHAVTFKQIKDKGVYSMDTFFLGTGRNTRKINYWNESFMIPVEDLPPYLREAMETEEIMRQFAGLLEKLGM